MDYFEIIKQRATSKASKQTTSKSSKQKNRRVEKNTFPSDQELPKLMPPHRDEVMINEQVPLIFISHCHSDQAIAEGLIDLLVEAISIDRTEIRATSVPGHKLPAGCNIGNELQQEITQAEIVLGIITKHVLESPYVLFELGAAWGLNKRIFPLIAQDVDPDQVLGPIASVLSLSLTNNPDCYQVVVDVSRQIKRSKKTGNDPGIAYRVERLVKVALAS